MATSATSLASSASAATPSTGKCIGCTSSGRSRSRCTEPSLRENRTAPERRRFYRLIGGPRARPAACGASEKQNGPQGDDAVLVFASGLVLSFRTDVFTHQIQALGEAVVQARDQGFVLFHQGRVRSSRLVRSQIQRALAQAHTRLELPDLVGPLHIPALRFALFQRSAYDCGGIEADRRRANPVAAVAIQHAFEVGDIHLGAEIERLTGNARACRRAISRRAAAFDFLAQGARPGLAADGSRPFIAPFGLKTGLIMPRRRSAGRKAREVEKVHSLEHA